MTLLTGDLTTSLRDKFLTQDGGLSRQEIRRRAGEAMLRNLPSFLHCVNDAKEWAIIGGGPSVKDHLKTIRRLKNRGVNIVSVNKSHDWLIENGIIPWGHILLDWNTWVKDYVKRPRRDVRYFIAGQCCNEVFDNLKDYPVFLWHAGQDFPEGDEPVTYLREKWPSGKQVWFCVPGPTTVGLRAPVLGHLMGADKFHMFGMDSSRSADGKMHGYEKTETALAEPGTLTIKHNGIKYHFDTNNHMARQLMDFDKMLEDLPENYANGKLRKEFALTFYGSGMLPFMAAKCGLHADPECNNDPTKVGGYTSAPDNSFTIILENIEKMKTMGPIDFGNLIHEAPAGHA